MSQLPGFLYENDLFFFVSLFLGVTLAVIFGPVLLAKAILQIGTGWSERNEKKLRNGIYWLLSSCILFYVITIPFKL